MTKTTEIKMDEVRGWWRVIEKAHKNRQLISVDDFADQAFKYVPILLAELDRLEKMKQ